MSASQDGSESVDQFLARIASVREGRDQASEQRTKRMEEDFLKSRKERQARRLERARSLSPSKTGPSTSSSMLQTPAAARDTALNPPVDFSPRASTLSRSNAVSARTSPKLEPKRLDSDLFSTPQSTQSSPNNLSGLSRSGTLSWQQRPARDGVLSRPRPLSTIETIRPIVKAEVDHVTDNSEPSRQEIAASLGSKDPSWFRQTQERGLKSAALRKSQVEDTATVEHTARSQILPGLSTPGTRSRSATPAPEIAPSPPVHGVQSPPLPYDKLRREASPNPVSTDAPKLESSPQQVSRPDAEADVTSNVVIRSGSILAGRSPSPTKGLGGFVESAMMKRSDSVNKRWSVQASAGLKRGDSIAGMRPISGVRSMHASSLSKNSHRDGSSSPIPTSRPESRDGTVRAKSQSATTDVQPDSSDRPEETQRSTTIDTITRPKSPVDEHLSRSPSKALDSRRWSPTKSSWLESALLSQPEPPKPQINREEVPAWKANLQRNKASRDLSPGKINAADDNLRNATPANSETSNQTLTGKRSELEPIGVVTTIPKTETDPKDTLKEQSVLSLDSPSKDLLPRFPDRESMPHSTTRKEEPPADDAKGVAREAVVEEKAERKPPPVLKPKPQTPPKTDFRSTLRARAPVSTKNNGAEPEFKAVFGKLKSAQTQNYVAPDTLKTNILTGKAALNTTGGPQKTQRVDELKESILQKKEAMKVSAVQKKDSPAAETPKPKPEPELPEALARRKTLHKASPSITKLQSSFGATQNRSSEPPKPAVPLKPKPAIAQASKPLNDDSGLSIPAEPVEAKKIVHPPPNLDPTKSLSPARQPASSAESNTSETKKAVEPSPIHSPAILDPVAVESISIPKAELPPGSKLASRLNPSLAALLSRGSSPHASPARSPSPERQSNIAAKQAVGESTNQESATAGELTHMTKGRARGPKRRAPKAQATTTPSSQSQTTRNAIKSMPPDEPVTKPTTAKSINSLKETFDPAPVTPATQAHRVLANDNPKPGVVEQMDKKSQDTEAKPKVKPSLTAKSPELRRVSSTVSPQQIDGAVVQTPVAKQFEIATDVSASTTAAGPLLTRDLPKTPTPMSASSPLTPSKSRVNTPKSAQSAANPPSKPLSPKPVAGLSLSAKSLPAKPVISSSELTPPPDRPDKPSTLSKQQLRGNTDDDLKSAMSAYFTKWPESQQKADFDAQALLNLAKEPNEKIKTIAQTIWEVSGDGKKRTMPPQQEHILFEESLYLVSHSFELGIGNKSSEVYLWCGSSVTDAALQDAQLFCRKDAREYNAKLEIVKQGKESARFFQALGGILITRRSKTSSLYMLRGRRHLGHLVFDEVDLTPSNLCSGFSYLISAKFGKLYLWKGQGSGADEVGCARLIGMDLGLTGEIEEVAEGQEPASFWDSFPERARKEKFSDDWRRRAEHDCYPTTLYRVELDQPKAAGGFWGLRAASPSKPTNTAAVERIVPFCDRDLEPSNVYVLDAYRSIYVILNSQATSKATEVVTALHLAQELAMLSPSIQDRSLLPSCFVILGEPPADVKICFRKWSDNRSSKSTKPAACLRLESVMEALNL